ncbi:MAG: hypothetical protein RDV48_25830 [Candidatus Eremiobacteraeota bacterium]|nr:hypothetical protein [Candidatus Eremiobacteraeota bacterium]
MEFFKVFHPLFLIFYISLFFCSVAIFKIYFVNNEVPSIFLSSLCLISLFISVWKFPQNLGENLMAFAGYIALASAPSSFLVIIMSKMLAEFLVGAKDFMGISKRDLMEELQEQVEALVIAGKFDEAIALLRDKMKKCPKDFRFNNEIATISLMYLKDYKTALSEFHQVLKKTDKDEPVAFALYRMVDIYLTYMNDREKAIEYLRKLITQLPDTEYSESAKIRLEFLEKSQQEDEMGISTGGWRSGESEKKAPFDFSPDEEGGEKQEEPFMPKGDWRKGFTESESPKAKRPYDEDDDF